MSYQIPSLRAVRTRQPVVFTDPQPRTAPAEIAVQRLAICRDCENNSSGNCRLFGCCNKDLQRTATLAFQKCPAGKWDRCLPSTLKTP
jgi:hypothetical protein